MLDCAMAHIFLLIFNKHLRTRTSIKKNIWKKYTRHTSLKLLKIKEKIKEEEHKKHLVNCIILRNYMVT